MNAYVSYYTFFSDNLRIIKDVRSDFKAASFSGVIFDGQYGTFINKMTARCHSFSTDSFMKSSKIISNYISEIGDTKNIQQNVRFDTLIKITERYMKVSM